MKKYEFLLKGLDCAVCANEVQKELSKNKELKNVNVNFAKLKLTYETDTVDEKEVIKIVNKVEPDVEVINLKDKVNENKNKLILQIVRIDIGIILALVGIYSNLPYKVCEFLILLGYATLLFRTTKTALKMLFKTGKINENFLITISCIGAFLIGERLEGLMVIFLYEIGKILEEKAINKSRKSIKDLMNIKPEYANLKKDKNIEKVLPEEVKKGEIILVKKGERIPLDGIVLTGTANLNTVSLTGESKLQKIKQGDKVLSGTIVIDGLIEVKTIEEYENSTVNRILELVEKASDKKAKTETFVNKAASVYTPIVIFLAILVAATLPLFTDVKYLGSGGSIYKALIFLVISCPCAIAISVPLSYFSGIGKASKEGILIKGSDYIDILKDIDEIVFDKTGTLTKGNFEIQEIQKTSNISEKDILKYAATGEQFSNHPIAKAILKNCDEKLENIEDFEEISGKGITYKYNGQKILVGNSKLVGIEKKEDISATIIYVKIDNEIIGQILLGDTIKEGTIEGINEIKKIGISVNMFTGDDKNIAKDIGKKIGIPSENIYSQMLPQDKYNELEKKLGNNKKVAYVGDGINDSPVLARADVGISMGGIGADSAIEASDVVIMTDNISKIYEAIKISKKTCRIIKENLIFAVGIKILILVATTIGKGGMWQAVFADVGVTIITILNTLRILKSSKSK